jgi:hypothetical protein
VLRAIGEGVRGLDPTITVEGSRLVAEGTLRGRSWRGVVETAAPPARPRDVADLLARGRFDALAEELTRGEPAYLGASGVGEVTRYEELVLADALATLREGVRHLRKLEDVGLAIHEGGDPTTIAAIALVVLIVSTLIVIAECESDESGGLDESSIDSNKACGIGVFLWVLALVTLGVLTGQKQGTGTGNANLVIGTVVVRGVGTDLEAVRS